MAELSPDRLRPSGALLAAELALGAAIEQGAVAPTGHDATTLDLLVRLDLAADGRLRAVDLCRQLLMSASHVSRLLDRAEEAGLVERTPDPADRRARMVALTDRGTAVVAEFAPHLDAVLDRVIFQTLDAAELRSLVGMLDRLEAAARSGTHLT